MNTGTIYVVSKGNERASFADKKSAADLINALTALDCTETFSVTPLNGNRQELPVYETVFFDKHINVVTLADAERVVHWMLNFGCNKVSIEKLDHENNDM